VETLFEFSGTKRFRVLRCIGIGGMGEVYEAVDRAHDTRVAIKVLPTCHPASLLRFKNEFRALRDLEHPNLVSYGELLEESGRWFFTMELVEGVDFLAYVRPGEDSEDDEESEGGARLTAPLALVPRQALPTASISPRPRRVLGFDEARLRHALAQLCRGVSALHAIGKVHRDIKPANIRVTGDGRVVLLDFGLVTDVEHPAYLTDGEMIVGTPLYMAPEQAARREVGPPADWYSVGVVLYRSLTRRHPFEGRARDVMRDKQDQEPPSPSLFAPAIPADLEALCLELLRRDPEARPRGDEILQRLGVPVASESSQSSAQLSPSLPSFVGRAPELAELARLLEKTRTGQPVIVVLHGESGVGKTALLNAFARHAFGRGAVALSARCYESELVPFKAVDGLIDALSRYMMALPRSEAAALLPAKAALLTQIFPVLRGVAVIAESPAPLDEVRDPQELRARAFAAVRELMARLAERKPLLLVLDDMQWSDADSLALLREIMRAPEPPALLLVLAARDTPGGDEPATILDASMMSADVRHIRLERLAPGEALELAAHALEQLSVDDDGLARTIAEEAAGHPLFIDELARHAQAAGGHPGPLRLDEALEARVQTLGVEAREILELISVAGTPIRKKIAARALDMDFAEFAKRTSILRVSHLVRWSDTGHAESIEPYHERVRAAVLSHMTASQLRACHRRLAVALEASNGDAEALAQHWRGAGEIERAVNYALRAAHQAASALAFDRAAQLYSLALSLGIGDAVAAARVQVRLGDALRHAGLGRDAATAYLSAAAGQTSAAEKLELKRSAAEQLLLSGHFDDGMAALRTVLGAIGMSYPPTPWRALLSLILHRVWLRLRGLHFRERDVSQVSAEELTRCDVSWAASAGLSITDNVRGADFQSRNLLHALHLGEPHRIARALAIEAGHASIDGQGLQGRAARLLATSEQLALKLGDRYALGLQKIVSAMNALLSGRWKRAGELCDEGEDILRARCTGVAWELDSAQSFGMDALWFRGELRELARRVPQRVAEAQARGDLYAVITFRTGASNLMSAVHDDVDGGRRLLDESMARWSQSGVHLQHYRELYARLHLDLYAGDGVAAHLRAQEAWPRLLRAQILRVALIRCIVLDLRARSAIACAMARPEQRRSLLAAALADARELERSPIGWCGSTSLLLRAGVAMVHDDRAVAIARLRQAIPGFEQVDMPMHAAAARRQLGRLLGGDEGESLVAAADAWMRRQDVKRPERFAAMLAPGFPLG
jgi:serine/threonine protein kinase